MPERVHQPGGIEHVTPDGCVVIAFACGVQQRKIIRCDEDRHAFFLRTVVYAQSLLVQGAAQHAVQFRRALHRHGQMEAVVLPPLLHKGQLLLRPEAGRKHVTPRPRGTVLDFPHQQFHDAPLVLPAHLHHVPVQPVGPTPHPPAERVLVRPLQSRFLQTDEQMINIQREIHRQPLQASAPREETPQQGQGFQPDILVARGFMHRFPFAVRQPPQRGRRATWRGTPGQCLP